MTANSKDMVLLFDAVMVDDDALLRCLLRKFPLMAKKASELSSDERDVLFPADSMTNHFYTDPASDDGKKVNFGLVVEDTATAKVLAGECNLVDYIYWGTNTDPVQVATAADIAEVLEVSEEHITPLKVLSLLKETIATERAQEDNASAKRPRSE